MGIDVELLVEELKRDEGYRAQVYQCSAGVATVGYGHNLEQGRIPEYIAEKLLHHDIGEAIADCESLNWFYTLDAVRKRVIVNMMFNIGMTRLLGFKKMIAAIELKDYNRAADEMYDSKWRVQVGDRAKRLVEMMRNG